MALPMRGETSNVLLNLFEITDHNYRSQTNEPYKLLYNHTGFWGFGVFGVLGFIRVR